MNKKPLCIIALLLAISILITGCAPERDLSTPSTTMVGHWGYYGIRDEPSLEVFFGEFDEQGIGSCYIKDSNETLSLTCTILGESEDNARVEVTEEGTVVFSNSWYPSSDGQTMTRDREQEFRYIDSKTEP